MLHKRWMGIDLRWILEAFETQLILIIGLKDKTERVESVNFPISDAVFMDEVFEENLGIRTASTVDRQSVSSQFSSTLS